jgi:hypothetical protein
MRTGDRTIDLRITAVLAAAGSEMAAPEGDLSSVLDAL